MKSSVSLLALAAAASLLTGCNTVGRFVAGDAGAPPRQPRAERAEAAEAPRGP